MIYQIRNPQVAKEDSVVYLPNCKTATRLQLYSLEHKQLPIPNWLPSLPTNIMGLLAYLLMMALVCLSSVLLASIFGVDDHNLVNVAAGTVAAIFVLQFIIGWYKATAAQFNYLAENLPAVGQPLSSMVSLQILRQLDSDTFDKSVEVMSNHYNGIYNISHRFCSSIDDYVEIARPIVERDYSSRISSETPLAEVYARYNQLVSSLQPLAENCLNFLRRELEYYEVEMIYM